MDFFTRNTPAYKSARGTKLAAATQPAATTGLSGLIGSLFGSATPAYKTRGARDAKASAPSGGLMSMFAVAPSYRAAKLADVAQEVPLEVDQIAEAGEPDLDDEGVPCVGATDELVLL